MAVNKLMEMFVAAHPAIVSLRSFLMEISQKIAFHLFLVQKIELFVDDSLYPKGTDGFRLREDRFVILFLGKGLGFIPYIHAQRFVPLHLHALPNPYGRIEFQI